MVDVPASDFVSVPGQNGTTLLNLKPTVPSLVAPLVQPPPFLTAIQTAVADNDTVNMAGNTALQPPNNFAFTDLTVNVSGEIPGDAFKGATTGITSQFIDLTPDNLLIRALNPGVFMRSDTGDDLLLANGGRNILSAGAGINIFVGGGGHDTFLADATAATTVNTILGFGSGDDAALLGVNITDFKFSISDTMRGLEIDATAIAANKPSASLVLPGLTISDIGSQLSLGISKTADSTSFLFVHSA